MRKRDRQELVMLDSENECNLNDAGVPPALDETIGNGEEIEFILKVPRTMDPQLAELLQKRFSLFVEEDIKNVYLTLRNAECRPAECK